MRCSAQALSELLADPKRCGFERSGFFGVYQSWTQDMRRISSPPSGSMHAGGQNAQRSEVPTACQALGTTPAHATEQCTARCRTDRPDPVLDAGEDGLERLCGSRRIW